MRKIELKDVIEEFRKADSFLLTTHANPDGDAIGSLIALGILLEGMGKKAVACANHDPVPRIYQWLPGAERVVGRDGLTGPFDLAVTIDVSQPERLDSIGDLFSAEQKHLVIDHHQGDGPEGAVGFVDPAYASAGEMVYELFAEAGVALTAEAAECLYVAIVTDTGGFRFSNTNARTHRVAAELLDVGVDVFTVSGRLFDTLPIPKFKLLRRVLERMVLSESGTHAFSTLTEHDLAEANGSAEDVDGLVNYSRNLEGVQVGMLFRERKDGKVKVSVRSRPGFDSAKALSGFGGGGHAGAAGAVISMPMEAARDAVLVVVRSMLGEEA